MASCLSSPSRSTPIRHPYGTKPLHGFNHTGHSLPFIVGPVRRASDTSLLCTLPGPPHYSTAVLFPIQVDRSEEIKRKKEGRRGNGRRGEECLQAFECCPLKTVPCRIVPPSSITTMEQHGTSVALRNSPYRRGVAALGQAYEQPQGHSSLRWSSVGALSNPAD